MGDCSAAGLYFIKKRVKAVGAVAEQALLKLLTPDERDYYYKALPVVWIPIEIAAEVYPKAAQVLLPGDASGVWKLGRDQAHADLSGIYRALLAVATVPFALRQASRFWSSYYKDGRAGVENVNADGSAEFYVADYPDLPSKINDVISGYIAGVMERAGARDIEVLANEQDPNKRLWSVTWS
jgi:hypothetical protein